MLGRPLLECGLIRYHRQRLYVLACVRLLLEILAMDDEDVDKDTHEFVARYATNVIFKAAPKDIISRCMAAMQFVKIWLQKVADRITAASVMVNAKSATIMEEMETVEFSRVSLVQQHEYLGIILCRSIERRQSKPTDFTAFLQALKKVDRYDHLLGERAYLDWEAVF